ncbi:MULTISPECIES: DUF692 domain-containing protein [unclassified Variovorax]|uniref:MNIO family bufferin maturase n=1 Tax=unclassified Variovorax TaxID=663243 RepID=UPI00076CA798|nr:MULTISPECIES: DUF692 domain-containing protein [unclassified Variovorax]KWT65666.1 protein of unknown function DUF692 [Variovorax sp. WDL1]PNG56692.1 hypothetical protein CHC07_03114 [Variovorax sp. B4]PNG58116.1 hypothetical protein CHC06_03117 [Variovorax sp. B2]VTV09386.1 hypothetical protein WDL1CHR_00508 [Variovorax sp. WDL1]
MSSPALTAGLGLKAEHYDAAVSARVEGLWFEVHPENYMVAGGPRLGWLEAVRERHPVSLHGVALSLAGENEPDAAHLRRLATLAERIRPALISEHLAWSAWNGHYFPDLLPFARTTEALHRIAANIGRAQDALDTPIAIENPSHYLRFDSHAWDEIDFLAELARRTGCTLLLDINNVHVSARNLGYSAETWLDRFPAALVSEIHLAGHSRDPVLGEALLIDSHDAPVAPEVWRLYRRFIGRVGARPTLIERDGNVPAFDTLMTERNIAEAALRESTCALEARP